MNRKERRAYNRAYYAAHREEINAYLRTYRAAFKKRDGNRKDKAVPDDNQ